MIFFFAQLRHLRHENFIRFNKFYGIVQQLEQNFIHPYNWMITSILLNICKCGTNINGKIWLKRILKSSLNFFWFRFPSGYIKRDHHLLCWWCDAACCCWLGEKEFKISYIFGFVPQFTFGFQLGNRQLTSLNHHHHRRHEF